MNTSHPTDPQQTPAEREFDAFLRDEDSRIAALYRKLPQVEPDAALDARVRAQAQQALREDTSATPTMFAQRRRASRWLPAFGVAATLVLAAGIVWRAEPQLWTMRNDAPAPTARSAIAPTTSDAASTRFDAPSVDAPSAQDKAASAQSASHDATLAAPAPPSAAQGATPATSAPPQPALEQKSAQVLAPPVAAATAKRKAIAARPPPPAFADAPLPKPVTPSAQKAETATAASADTQPSASADAMQDRAPQRTRSAAEPFPPPAAMMLATPTVAPPPQPELSAAPPPAPPPPPLAAPPASAAEAAPMPAPVSAPAPAANRASAGAAPQPAAPSSPQHWIARIRILLEQHQRDEAIWNLKQFRSAYPDYPLPSDLRDFQ